MKNWIKGAGLIAIGVLVSFGISIFIIEEEFYMLNPQYKNILLVGIVCVPAVVYEIAYVLWYHRCAVQKSRSLSVYKGEIFLALLAAVIDIIVLLSLFEVLGIFNEALIHIGISFVCSTIFFFIAFLSCKPF